MFTTPVLQPHLFEYFFLTLYKAIFEWLTFFHQIPEILYDTLCQFPDLIHNLREYLHKLIEEKRGKKLEGLTIEEWKFTAEQNFKYQEAAFKTHEKYINKFNLWKLIEFKVEMLEVEVVERDIVIEQHCQWVDFWAKEYCEIAVNP